jgi:single-strand DNA-binding protein
MSGTQAKELQKIKMFLPCLFGQSLMLLSIIYSLLKFKAMVLVGRITKDAIVNTLIDERDVVNFSVAINDYYKPKGTAERIKLTTYVNCSYWISSKVAERLKKSTLVEISGRIFVSAYTDLNSNAKASLNCHVNTIKIHSWGKEGQDIGTPATTPGEDKKEDLPF